MDLRSGLPYWRAIDLALVPAGSTFVGDIKCQVAILGGGITGALVAYYLTREGVETVLVDRRDFGSGSTAASTGLLQYEIDTPLVELIRIVGEPHAVHAYRRGLTAIDDIERLVQELGDPCGFARARHSISQAIGGTCGVYVGSTTLDVLTALTLSILIGQGWHRSRRSMLPRHFVPGAMARSIRIG